jgi:hypothetical protein
MPPHHRHADRSRKCVIGSAILPAMKLYFAGPLFSAAEREWNAEVTASLRGAGHQVFLPQE